MTIFGKFNKSSSVEELIEKTAKRLNIKLSEAKCYLNKEKSSLWDVLKSIETFYLEIARNIPMPFTFAYSFSNAGEYLCLLMLIALLVATALFIYNIVLFVAAIALVAVSAALAFIIHKIDALLVNHNSWLMKFVYYAIALPFIVIQTTISEIIFFLRGLMFSKSKNNTKFYLYATLISVAATIITILTITNILAMPNTALISIYCLVLTSSLSLIIKLIPKENENNKLSYIVPISVSILALSLLSMSIIMLCPLFGPDAPTTIAVSNNPAILPIILSIISVVTGLIFAISYADRNKATEDSTLSTPYQPHKAAPKTNFCELIPSVKTRLIPGDGQNSSSSISLGK